MEQPARSRPNCAQKAKGSARPNRSALGNRPARGAVLHQPAPIGKIPGSRPGSPSESASESQLLGRLQVVKVGQLGIKQTTSRSKLPAVRTPPRAICLGRSETFAPKRRTDAHPNGLMIVDDHAARHTNEPAGSATTSSPTPRAPVTAPPGPASTTDEVDENRAAMAVVSQVIRRESCQLQPNSASAACRALSPTRVGGALPLPGASGGPRTHRVPDLQPRTRADLRPGWRTRPPPPAPRRPAWTAAASRSSTQLRAASPQARETSGWPGIGEEQRLVELADVLDDDRHYRVMSPISGSGSARAVR
jgi:hypothetical protein